MSSEVLLYMYGSGTGWERNPRSESLCEFCLLGLCQGGREFDVHFDDKVASESWLFRLWHALCWEFLFKSRWCWSGSADTQLSSVDSVDCARPASQRLLEAYFDGRYQVIANTLQVWMFFL